MPDVLFDREIVIECGFAIAKDIGASAPSRELVLALIEEGLAKRGIVVQVVEWTTLTHDEGTLMMAGVFCEGFRHLGAGDVPPGGNAPLLKRLRLGLYGIDSESDVRPHGWGT